MNSFFALLCLLSALAYARSFNPRINGGHYASQNREYPYVISIQRGNEAGGTGALIGERFVLTAAHLFVDENSKFRDSGHYKAVAGIIDWKNPKNSQSADVDKIYIPTLHRPQYTLAYDIAILKLKQDIGLKNGLMALNLPRNHGSYDGAVAKFAGFGWNWVQYHSHIPDKIIAGGSDGKLKYLQVHIKNNTACQKQYREHYHPSVLVHETQVCGQALQPTNSWGEPAGICFGDSGGPLVSGNTIIGVLSQGTKYCREDKLPAIYVRVSKFIDFIDNVMSGKITNDIRVYNENGIEERTLSKFNK